MISIIIPTSGNTRSIKRLCDSILGQRNHEEYEVLVIANPPSLSMRALLNLYPKNFYYGTSKNGANHARNEGIRRSKGRYLLFLDDDCVLPHQSYLNEATKALDDHQDWGGYGGPYRPLSKARSQYDITYCYIQNKWLLESALPSGRTRHLVGGNMILRRSLFETYGLFSEKLIFGGTETEFLKRLNREVLVFNQKHFVYHDYRLSRWLLFKKAFMQGAGRQFIQETHPATDMGPNLYGSKEILKEFNLPAPSPRSLSLYKESFQAGERYYQKHRRTKFKLHELVGEYIHLEIQRIRARTVQKLDELICIIENIRGSDADK